MGRLSELYGGECIPFPCDLSTSDGIDSFTNMIADKEDGIDYLINNAGAAWGEPFESFSEAGWDKVMDLNVKTLFFLTQKMKPLLAKKATLEDPSRVINIGSIDGLNVPGFPTFSYSTSKAAVHHLTRHLAAQLVSENIVVNAIAPGLALLHLQQYFLKQVEQQGVLLNDELQLLMCCMKKLGIQEHLTHQSILYLLL